MGSLPKVPGPLYGYRAWQIKDGALWSLWHGARWSEREPRTALCWRNFLGFGHPAPHSGCTCGIWAWKNPPTHAHAPHGVVPVLGVVELSGIVVGHRLGFRAQHARPVAIQYTEGVDEVVRRYRLLVLEELSEWKT